MAMPTHPANQAAPVLTAMTEAPQVEIVLPVHNEERDLPVSVQRLHDHLTDGFPFRATITVVDNGSTDDTWVVASRLAERLPLVRAVRLPRPGRGGALAHVWSTSSADVVAYMDVDLSTDLNALLPLVAPLLSGHSDLAVGTRLSRGARVLRGPKRELISRAYNGLLHVALGTSFSDAQCGFKAVRRDAARLLLPLVEDAGWFFDTELLVQAERAGLRIYEVPVDWRDDPDSRVDIVSTAWGDLRGVARLARRGSPARRVASFGLIGVASTLAYLLLYLAFRDGMAAQPANALALLITAVANTAANRRFTFGVRGHRHVGRHQTQGLAVFGLGLALTSWALAVLTQIDPRPSRLAELGVLVAANVTATVLRYLLFRGWVFRAPPPPLPPPPLPPPPTAAPAPDPAAAAAAPRPADPVGSRR